MSKVVDFSPIDEAEEAYMFFSQFDELSIEQVKMCCEFHFKKQIETGHPEMKLFYDLAKRHVKKRTEA